MYAANDLSPKCPPSTKREPTIPVAVDRLENAAAEFDGLVSSTVSAFGPVIYHQPTPGEAIRERDSIPGSDLGQTLTKLADRFERSNRALRLIVEQADV
jgi:hypothetical protein